MAGNEHQDSKSCEAVKCSGGCCEQSQREWTEEEQVGVIESKQWRKELDKIIQEIKNSTRNSRERSLCVTKLQEAIMWAGMDLKALNDGRTIYKESYNPENTIVEPNADDLKM